MNGRKGDKQIRTYQKIFYFNKSNNFIGDSRENFKLINEIKSKTARPDFAGCGLEKKNNYDITEPEDIANSFIQFFFTNCLNLAGAVPSFESFQLIL